MVEWLRFDAIGKLKPVTAPLISNEVGEAMGSFRTAWATAVHDLRHEYACRLAERGVPVTKIQVLLGHAAITTTMRYIHHTLDELAKATTVLVSQVRPLAENPKSGGVH